MKKYIDLIFIWTAVIVGLYFVGESSAYADPLVWQTPYGTYGLPFSATEALIGYDGITKEAIAGFSLPVYTDPKGIVALQVGAIAPWQTNQATIQPYVAAGHDILREIPYLSQFQSAHLNVFGRWDSGSGRAGAGISFSYGFAGGASPATVASGSVTPAAPQTSNP
jgi:hypothetical protein